MGNQQNKSYMNEDVDLTHFKLLRSIGRGSFGKVRIIEHKITKAKLALKYFSKEDLIKRKMSKNIIRERNMLEGLSHPFVCNLRYAFQDDYNLYMALDLMLGGDLRFHLHRRKFSEDELIFLAAEISSAIGYLHSKNIIHRDIKPDNILLDEKGHAHLTDFNIAAYIQPNHLLKSHSGTAQYMAPEMVGDQGYSYGVDWWSLGITFYEGIYGKTPFYDSIKRTRKKECILEQHIDFNVHTVLELSPLFFEFVQKLLNKNPNQRLGSGKTGFFSIQRLPLFNGIEWDLLEKKMLRPPFCPSSEKHNFDMTYDLEELLLEDYPLESLPSKRSKDPKKMSVDMLYLENYYKSYDYYEGPKLRRYSDEQLNKPEMKESPNISKTTVVETDGLGELSCPPPVVPVDSKAFRRRSRSLMNLYEKTIQGSMGLDINPQSFKEVRQPKPKPKSTMISTQIPTQMPTYTPNHMNVSPNRMDGHRPSTSSDCSNRTEGSNKELSGSSRSSLKKLFFGAPKKNPSRKPEPYGLNPAAEDVLNRYF